MMAIVAAVLFGIALLLMLLDLSVGPLLTPSILTTAGLLFVALQLAGIGPAWRGRSRRRR